MKSLSFFAEGRPAPQGSKTSLGGARMKESSKHVKPWRECVKWACHNAMVREFGGQAQYPGAVIVTVTFFLKAPKSRPNAYWCDTAPDLDKLLRATFDALTDSGVIVDDRKIVMVRGPKKVYAGRILCRGLGVMYESEKPGAMIEIEAVE